MTFDDIDKLIADIHRGVITIDNLPIDLYLESSGKFIKNLEQGYGFKLSEVDKNSAQYNTLIKLRDNLFRFSGVKTFQNVKELEAVRFSLETGFLKTLKEYRVDALPIYDKFNRDWSATEIDTTLTSADFAAKTDIFKEEAETFPMLRYQTAGDANVREEHAALDGITKPVDDPFWDNYMPPNGFNCYDRETEIYTDKGWCKFENLDKSLNVLTLNPENKNIEWQLPVNYIKQIHSDKMISIKANNMDVCVTPDHKMLVQKGWDRTKKRDVLKLIDAKDIATGDRIFRTGNWTGKEQRVININGLKFDVDTYLKFIAWYLSDGSTTKRGNDWYQIKISQNKDQHYSDIVEDLKDFPVKAYYGHDYIGFSSKTLGEYLTQFGKANKKYIPQIIKDLKPEKIKVFLDTYVKADGNITKPQIKENGYSSKPIHNFYSTSKKLIDDIGELIIKTDRLPSFGVSANAGKKGVIRGKEFTSNYDMHYVRINQSKYFNVNVKKHITYVDYNNYVYCVEVPKYSTLLIRRNNKVYWSGNCRCDVIQLRRAKETSLKPGELEEKTGNITDLFKNNSANSGVIFKPDHPYNVVGQKYEAQKQLNFGFPMPE